MTPVSGDTMAMAAMIEAMRAQTTAVQRANDKLDDMTSAVAKVREDIAVMKVRDEQFSTLATLCYELTKRMEKVELLHAQEAGRWSMMEVIRNWSPWIAAVLVGLWAMLERKPS